MDLPCLVFDLFQYPLMTQMDTVKIAQRYDRIDKGFFYKIDSKYDFHLINLTVLNYFTPTLSLPLEGEGEGGGKVILFIAFVLVKKSIYIFYA